MTYECDFNTADEIKYILAGLRMYGDMLGETSHDHALNDEERAGFDHDAQHVEDLYKKYTFLAELGQQVPSFKVLGTTVSAKDRSKRVPAEVCLVLPTEYHSTSGWALHYFDYDNDHETFAACFVRGT